MFSVEITDGLKGWDTRQMVLCISPKTDAKQICEFLSETYNDISEAIPINQDKIRRYVEKNNHIPSIAPGR